LGKELDQKTILVNLIDSNQYSLCCNDDKYVLNHPDFNQLPRLIETKKI